MQTTRDPVRSAAPPSRMLPILSPGFEGAGVQPRRLVAHLWAFAPEGLDTPDTIVGVRQDRPANPGSWSGALRCMGRAHGGPTAKSFVLWFLREKRGGEGAP